MTFASRQSVLWHSYRDFEANRQRFQLLRQAPQLQHLDWLELGSPVKVSELVTLLG